MFQSFLQIQGEEWSLSAEKVGWQEMRAQKPRANQRNPR
jgi:hypothetical protein